VKGRPKNTINQDDHGEHGEMAEDGEASEPHGDHGGHHNQGIMDAFASQQAITEPEHHRKAKDGRDSQQDSFENGDPFLIVSRLKLHHELILDDEADHDQESAEHYDPFGKGRADYDLEESDIAARV
jgi:hypothetical protein